MTHRHLLASTSTVAALGYDSTAVVLANELAAAGVATLADPRAPKAVDWFERRDADSLKMFGYWEKVDAILDGIDGMKEKGADFLPKFAKEEPDDYAFRKSCATMTNVYRDIVEGLAAKPFEQAVQFIESQDDTEAGATPRAIKDFAWDVDGSGNNLTVFASRTFFNGINNAIDWIMVDHPPRDPSVRSIADARARNVRPYWSHVLGRNVLAAQSRMVGSKEVLTYIKILEPGTPQHIREFERYDWIDGETPRHRVEWRLWQKRYPTVNASREEYVLIESGDVSIGVIPMVPFVTGRRDGRRWRFDPPMRAAVEMQITLFRQETELEYKSTMSAYSMLAGNGIEPPKGPDGKPDLNIRVSPSAVLWSPPRNDGGPAGRWEWIEPSSEILKFLQERVDTTIQNLRELGRQPLTASSSNITVITAAVAAGKAKSAVKAWAYQLKDALENAFVLTAMWMAISETYDPTLHVFAEFDDWMEGEDIEALNTMRSNGDLSAETLYEEMQRRGVLSSNFTVDRERRRLLADTPVEGPEPDAP